MRSTYVTESQPLFFSVARDLNFLRFVGDLKDFVNQNYSIFLFTSRKHLHFFEKLIGLGNIEARVKKVISTTLHLLRYPSTSEQISLQIWPSQGRIKGLACTGRLLVLWKYTGFLYLSNISRNCTPIWLISFYIFQTKYMYLKNLYSLFILQKLFTI